MPTHVSGRKHLAGFAANARFYAPEVVLETLQAVAHSRDLALIVDVETTDLDHVIVTALEALSHANVLVALVGDGAEHRPLWAMQSLRKAWSLDKRLGWPVVTAQVRARFIDPCLVAVTDQPTVRTVLSDRDGLILTTAPGHLVGAGVAVSSAASLRAALWWLVHARSRVAQQH